MIIYFIRHGATAGNVEKRYIGRTDESLCPEGIEQLQNLRRSMDVHAVFTSPMKRCIETADILYPENKKIIIDDFRECDFGDFEGHNYKELSGNADYQRWIDSGGTIPFPGGESPMEFKKRCNDGFMRLLEIADATEKKDAMDNADCSSKAVALVVHGGTIMSILEKYESHHEYYRWQCANGSGYKAVYEAGCINVKDRL